MKGTTSYSGVFFCLVCALLYGCPDNTSVAESGVDTLRTATIVFGGDVMQHSQQVRAARQADGSYSYNAVFAGVKRLFESADVAVVNLETTLSDKGPYTGYPLFRSPDALALGLAEAGVDVALLANNHICDRGATGIRKTIAALDSARVRYTGAWADSVRSDYPIRLDVGGFDIRLLNYTYGTNGMPVPKGMRVNMLDTAVIAQDLESIVRTDSTIIIAALHWGNEYQRKPSREQRELAGWLNLHGVDIIVGGHPHVVQPIDYETLGAAAISFRRNVFRIPTGEWWRP